MTVIIPLERMGAMAKTRPCAKTPDADMALHGDGGDGTTIFSSDVDAPVVIYGAKDDG